MIFFFLILQCASSGWIPLGSYSEDNPQEWQQSVAEGAAYASSSNSVFSFGGFTYDERTVFSRNDLSDLSDLSNSNKQLKKVSDKIVNTMFSVF